MSLTKNTTTVNNIQSLADRPTETASQVKVLFDKTGADLKTYINNVLTVEQDALNASFATKTGSETITNKTIDVDNNTVTNIEVDNLKSGVLDTDLSSVSASDDTIPSAKATKTALDLKIPTSYLDTDGTLTANSDTKIASQKASKTYIDTVASNFVLGTVPDGSIIDDKLSNTAGQIKPRVATAEGKVTQLETDRGTMASLTTTEKTNLVGAINEVKSLGGKTDNYYTTLSASGNIGALVLDGSNDYGTIPATVGQLTTAGSTFELVVKFKTSTTSQFLISKRDTGYSTNTLVKGWGLRCDSGNLALETVVTNGSSAVNLVSTLPVSDGQLKWAKVTFNGTTVEIFVSNDGINFVSGGTSTNANLISALGTTDNVLTQIGRHWTGSSGYTGYFNGTIYNVIVTKAGTVTNTYHFTTFGTDQAIEDTTGTDDGVSAGGAVQGVSGTNYTRNTGGKYTAFTDNMIFKMVSNSTASTAIQPTLNLDTLGAKPIIGSTITADRQYELRYISALDSYYATTLEEKKVIPTFVLPVAASTFTIGGLNIVRDGGFYEIVITDFTPSTSANLSMYINGDVTATNYYNGNINSSGTTNNGIIIATGGTGDATEATILMKVGVRIGATILAENPLSTQVTGIAKHWGHKTYSASNNVNSITFTMSSGNISTATVNIYKR